MRLLSVHILPRNASNFTSSHLDFKNFPEGKSPDPCYWGGEGKGGDRVPTSKGSEGMERTGEGQEGWEGKRRGRGWLAAGGILLQGLRGDRRPCPERWHQIREVSKISSFLSLSVNISKTVTGTVKVTIND